MVPTTLAHFHDEAQGGCSHLSESTQHGLVCDVDTHKNLYAYVVSSGGTNTVPEIFQRMTKEPTTLAPFTTKLMLHLSESSQYGLARDDV